MIGRLFSDHNYRDGIMRLYRLYLHMGDTVGQNGLLGQSGPC